MFPAPVCAQQYAASTKPVIANLTPTHAMGGVYSNCYIWARGPVGILIARQGRHLADDADLRVRAPRGFWRLLDDRSHEPGRRRDPRLPAVGSELKRTYQGR